MGLITVAPPLGRSHTIVAAVQKSLGIEPQDRSMDPLLVGMIGRASAEIEEVAGSQFAAECPHRFEAAVIEAVNFYLAERARDLRAEKPLIGDYAAAYYAGRLNRPASKLPPTVIDLLNS